MISLWGTYFSLENIQSALVKIDRKDFHNELVEKTVSGYPLKRFKNAPNEHMKKRERSMLLFKLDTSHARMGLLLPRSGSRLNKSQLPDESSNDSKPLCELHFQLALFFCKLALFFCKLALFFQLFFAMALFFCKLALFFFALAFSFSFQKKKLALF